MYSIKNPVLVVVDMQNGFLGAKSSYVIPKVRDLVNEIRRREIPIVFTRFHNREGSPYETLIGWKRLRDNSETEITCELQPFIEVVIDKDFYSSFTEEFSRLAYANNWKTIILCGVATESCVMKTAVDAFEKGLVPIVVADACASHAGNEVHEAGLMILGRFIGKQQIKSTGELLETLSRTTTLTT
jgi:nicotinamidase-related amidase